MLALIVGWGESGSKLIEQVIGIYDSESTVPKKFRQKEHYYGIIDEVPDKHYEKYYFGKYTGTVYYRLQPVEINKMIHLNPIAWE